MALSSQLNDHFPPMKHEDKCRLLLRSVTYTPPCDCLFLSHNCPHCLPPMAARQHPDITPEIICKESSYWSITLPLGYCVTWHDWLIPATGSTLANRGRLMLYFRWRQRLLVCSRLGREMVRELTGFGTMDGTCLPLALKSGGQIKKKLLAKRAKKLQRLRILASDRLRIPASFRNPPNLLRSICCEMSKCCQLKMTKIPDQVSFMNYSEPCDW